MRCRKECYNIFKERGHWMFIKIQTAYRKERVS